MLQRRSPSLQLAIGVCFAMQCFYREGLESDLHVSLRRQGSALILVGSVGSVVHAAGAGRVIFRQGVFVARCRDGRCAACCG